MKQQLSLPPAASKRSLWLWLAAILLGLFTWWGVNWWLEQRPLWQRRFIETQPQLSLLCENETGTWVAALEASKQNTFLILDANTGKAQYQLGNPEHPLSENLYIQMQSMRIVGQILWRCTVVKENHQSRYELRAWHFTQENKERVVQQWIVPDGSPFEILFSSKDSPYFIIRTEYPWHPGLATLLTDGLTGLSSILALQNVDEWMTAAIPVVPWLRTYRLSGQLAETPKQLASWSMPTLKWGKPSIGPEARWIIFGDTVLPGRWTAHANHKFCQPLGLLFYDGHRGEQRFLADEIAVQSEPRKVVTWANLIRVCEVTDPISIRWYHGNTGKAIVWPSTVKAPDVFGKSMQDRISPDKGIYDKDSQLYLLALNQTTIEGFPLAKPEKLEDVEISQPVYVQDRYVAYHGYSNYQPRPLRWLGEQWPWCKDKIEKIWPANRPGFYLFDTTTGKKEWQVQDVYECHFVRDSSNHMYTSHSLIRGFPPQESEEILTAWAIPFRFYSPWWGRCAGLMAFIVIVLLGGSSNRSSSLPKFPSLSK